MKESASCAPWVPAGEFDLTDVSLSLTVSVQGIQEPGSL